MRRFDLILVALAALGLALTACVEEQLDDRSIDDAEIQSALEAIADDIGVDDDGSLGALDDSDEEPGFGGDTLDGDDLDEGAHNALNEAARNGAECGVGGMAGYWVRTRERAGVFGGRLHLGDGEGPHGWVAGRFGVSPDGQQQFHGKAIDASGQFRAFVAGTWGAGEINGQMYGRDGLELGQVRGTYSNGGQARNRFRAQYRHRCRTGEGEPCDAAAGECGEGPADNACDPEVGDCEQDREQTRSQDGSCDPDAGDCEQGQDQDQDQDHTQTRDCDPDVGECEPGNGDRDRDCNPEESDCEPDHDRDCDPETAGCDEAGPGE